MTNTKVIAIAAVAIILIAGVATVVIATQNNENKSSDSSDEFDTRLAIFGNANGDDVLDEKDISLIQDIIDQKVTYDSEKYRYADTNTDGVINSSDIAALNNIIAGQSETLYYYGIDDTVSKISYPLTGPIAVHHVYPMDALIILGLYDNVVGMTNQGFLNTVGKDLSRYPGIGAEIVNIGTPEEDSEKLLDTGAKVYIQPFSMDNTKIKKVISDEGSDLQIVGLPMSTFYPGKVNQYGSLLMLGVMFNKADRAKEYIAFIDKIEKDINEKVSKASQEYTFITPFQSVWSPITANSMSLDTVKASGQMFGDVYTINRIMKSVNPISYVQYMSVSLEAILTINPDVIVIVQSGDSSATVTETQAELDNVSKVFKDTSAYKNGRIYSVNYYNIANYAGIPTLPLLASLIWPDLFDYDESLAVLQEYYDKYTMYENVDVSTMGYAIAYQANLDD